MAISKDRQIQNLLNMGAGSFHKAMKIFSVILTLGLVLAGVMTGNPPYYMVAAFSGLVALSMFQALPHIKNAVTGLKEGTRSQGNVTLRITQWSDSDSFHAFIHGPSAKGWAMDFIPQGWTPLPGDYDMELIHIPNVPWPVLVMADQGIFFPRSQPKSCTNEEFMNE